MVNQFKNPILEGKGATDYERYLRTDELLSLQTATSKLSHPDEAYLPGGASIVRVTDERSMLGVGTVPCSAW